MQSPSGTPWITQQTMFCVPTGTGRSSLILQGWVSAEGSRETPRVVKMLYRRMPLWCARASTTHPQIWRRCRCMCASDLHQDASLGVARGLMPPSVWLCRAIHVFLLHNTFDGDIKILCEHPRHCSEPPCKHCSS